MHVIHLLFFFSLSFAFQFCILCEFDFFEFYLNILEIVCRFLRIVLQHILKLTRKKEKENIPLSYWTLLLHQWTDDHHCFWLQWNQMKYRCSETMKIFFYSNYKGFHSKMESAAIILSLDSLLFFSFIYLAYSCFWNWNKSSVELSYSFAKVAFSWNLEISKNAKLFFCCWFLFFLYTTNIYKSNEKQLTLNATTLQFKINIVYFNRTTNAWNWFTKIVNFDIIANNPKKKEIHTI